MNGIESLLKGFKWSPYIPHAPTAKQLSFLLLPHKEALYGGAAGGGKSDALLMEALRYMDIPGFTAMLFRKTLSDLKLPGALLDRAAEWLAPWVSRGGVTYQAREHCYVFPTKNADGTPGLPARLQFGYIGQTNAHFRYQGIEVQFCGFDELTQHFESDYTYLFSRLRRNVCPKHTERDEEGDPIYHEDCGLCQQQRLVVPRMRAATNPGGVGHRWVRERFMIEPDVSPAESRTTGRRANWRGLNPQRPFIPAFLTDNKYLDQKAYESGLEELDPVTRGHLKYGDWAVSSMSRFDPGLTRYYYQNAEYYILPNGDPILPSAFSNVFATVDPAATSRKGPGDTENYRTEPSWTVISTWGHTHSGLLLWLDMRRLRAQIPDVVKELARVRKVWRPNYFRIEKNGVGEGVWQVADAEGLPVVPVPSRKDKVDASAEAQVMWEQGRIILPKDAPWLKTAETELFGWSGNPYETDDIVDTVSAAAQECHLDTPRSFLRDRGLMEHVASYHETPHVMAYEAVGW